MSNLMGLFLLPFLLALLSPVLKSFSKPWFKRGAFLLSLVPVFVLFFGYNSLLGKEESYLWFSPLSINFALKIDYLSYLFLMLSSLVVTFAILAGGTRSYVLYTLIFILEGLLFGFFLSRDLFFFVLFWEAMLIPLYFIIIYWGGDEKQKAAFNFLLYMIAGSLLMIAGVVSIYVSEHTFAMDQLFNKTYPLWTCAVFLLAFAVKTPLFPFHGWLPLAYTQAPTAGSILLAGILSKAGIYGLLRLGYGFFPDLLLAWSPYLLTFAIIGVFYGAFAAWGENNYKKLIAYSSFSHVNFILAGLFALNYTSASGAVLQSFSHGITITALFLVAKWLRKRVQTTEMKPLKGLSHYYPYLTWITLFFVLASIALPGTSNFIGEFLILVGLFSVKPWFAAVLTVSVILSAIYMLRWMSHVYFGAPAILHAVKADIGFKQFCIAAPLIGLILAIGIYPNLILNPLKNDLNLKISQMKSTNEEISK